MLHDKLVLLVTINLGRIHLIQPIMGKISGQLNEDHEQLLLDSIITIETLRSKESFMNVIDGFHILTIDRKNYKFKLLKEMSNEFVQNLLGENYEND